MKTVHEIGISKLHFKTIDGLHKKFKKIYKTIQKNIKNLKTKTLNFRNTYIKNYF